jgi:hypothetical protein
LPFASSNQNRTPIIFLEDNTRVTAYTSSGRSQALRLGRGEVADLSLKGTAKQGADDAVHLVADKPITAAAYADGDGAEATVYFERLHLGRHFGIPVDTQYLRIVCPEPATQVTLSDAGVPDTRVCDGDGIYPGKVAFGSPTNGLHIGAGAILDADKPVYVIYETGTSNDEHNLLGRP